GSGIAAWFTLGETAEWAAFLFLASGFAVCGFSLVGGRAGRALEWFTLAAALGCALVWTRSVWVEQPRLRFPIVAEVTGRVESVEVLAVKDQVRLTLALAD